MKMALTPKQIAAAVITTRYSGALIELLIESRTPHYGISLLYHADTERALFYYGDDVQNDAAFLENAAFMHYLGELISNTTDYVYDQWFFYSEGAELNVVYRQRPAEVPQLRQRPVQPLRVGRQGLLIPFI